MSEVTTGGAPTAAPAATEATNPHDPKQAAPNIGANATQGQSPAKEAAQEAMRKFKLKVDGQEVEVDEEELKRGYSHQRAASKRMQEAAKKEKQAEEFISLLKDKQAFFEAAKRLGHDPRKLAEEYLAAQLEEEMLDPREKELKEAKRKLQAYEEMEKRQREEAEKKRDQALKAKFAEDYTKQFTEALKETNLPPTKAMVAEMAKYIHRAAKMNFQMTAKEAAQLVKEDIETAHRNLYGEADVDTLVKLLGDQGLQKLRSYDASRVKDPMANLKTPTEQPEASTRARSTGKRMTPQEWRAFNRK